MVLPGAPHRMPLALGAFVAGSEPTPRVPGAETVVTGNRKLLADMDNLSEMVDGWIMGQ